MLYGGTMSAQVSESFVHWDVSDFLQCDHFEIVTAQNLPITENEVQDESEATYTSSQAVTHSRRVHDNITVFTNHCSR